MWSRTGMDIPESTSFDDWVSLGDQLRSIERSVMWWIGDWLRFGERRYGETYTQAIEVTGLSYGTLAQAKYVSGAYDISSRLENLPWKHHQTAAALPALERQHALQQASDNGWSAAELREHVQSSRGVAGPGSPLPATYEPRKFQRLGKMMLEAFCDWFGLGEGYASLLMVLFTAGGETLTPRQLCIAVDTHRPISIGALHEAISTLRKVLETEALDTNERGYSLTEIGMRECRRAIREEAVALGVFGQEPANDERERAPGAGVTA